MDVRIAEIIKLDDQNVLSSQEEIFLILIHTSMTVMSDPEYAITFYYYML